MFLLEASCSIFQDDIALCYHNSLSPKTVQSNTTAFTIETVLFLQKLATYFNHHQAKLLQIHTKEGITNTERVLSLTRQCHVNKKYKNQ
jgi:hypothetical protein